MIRVRIREEHWSCATWGRLSGSVIINKSAYFEAGRLIVCWSRWLLLLQGADIAPVYHLYYPSTSRRTAWVHRATAATKGTLLFASRKLGLSIEGSPVFVIFIYYYYLWSLDLQPVPYLAAYCCLINVIALEQLAWFHFFSAVGRHIFDKS